MLGYTAGGWSQYEAYRPSIQSFSDEITKARDEQANPSSRIPLPYGWDFDKVKDALILEPSAQDFVRYVKAFGFVAHLNDSSSDDTASAFTATVVLKLPFRFGEKESEALPSWAFARVSAFAAKALLPKKSIFFVSLSFTPPFFDIFSVAFWVHTCIPSGFTPVTVGEAVTGVIKLTGGDYKNTHLSAWRPCSFAEWKAASPESFFDRSFRGLPPHEKVFERFLPPFFGGLLTTHRHRVAD